MEDVDIVDVNDIVISKSTKKEAHEKGLLHRCVIAEVKNSKGQWLFVKQASDKQDAGQFVSPMGGHVTAGESIEDALKRETYEELGLKDFEYKFIRKAIYNRKVVGRYENHLFVLYEIYTDATPQLNHESENYVYFTKDELKTELTKYPEKFGDAFHYLVQEMYPQLVD